MEKGIKFEKILLILFYSLVFVMLLKHSYGYLDPDLGWHLKVGEQILKEKTVPHQENYDYVLEGKTWVDHEWLPNAVLYWLYVNFGYFPINLLFALIFLATLWIINLTFKRFFGQQLNPYYIIFLQALGLAGAFPHLGVRIQEFSVLFLAFLLHQIYSFEKNKNIKALIPIPFLFYFWACSHAGFLLGLGLLGSWLGVKIIEAIIKKTKYSSYFHLTRISKKDLISFTAIFLLSFLATLLTPYGLELYDFLGAYSGSYYQTHIAEWLPFYYYPIQYAKLFYEALTVVAVLLLVIMSIFKAKKDNGETDEYFKINLWHTFILAFFCFMAMKAVRHFPLLFIASYPIIMKFFCDIFGSRPKLFNLDAQNANFIKTYIIIALVLSIIQQAISIRIYSDPFKAFCNIYPCEAVRFLKENEHYDAYRILNEYDWGGFMIWTYPERKLFIDGRLPQYKFNNWTFMQEYHDFFNEGRTATLLAKYDIKLVHLKSKLNKVKLNWFEKYFLMMDEGSISEKSSNLKKYLEKSEEWDPVHQDGLSMIYARKK